MDRLHHLLENPQDVHVDDLMKLSQLVESYPYFQAGRSLYLKCLKENNSPSYNKELQITAAHTTDRSVLFDFITSPKFLQNTTSASIKNYLRQNDHINVEEEEVDVRANDLNENADFNNVVNPNLFEKKADITSAPLEFKPDESYSFNEWLKLTKLEPLKKEEVDEDKMDVNQELRLRKMKRIDQFLAERPKIKPLKSGTNIKAVSPNLSTSTPPMTETLARVYLAQNNYDKAIKSYEILVLQHPEKSSFFADRIQEIKNLQSNT